MSMAMHDKTFHALLAFCEFLPDVSMGMVPVDMFDMWGNPMANPEQLPRTKGV